MRGASGSSKERRVRSRWFSDDFASTVTIVLVTLDHFPSVETPTHNSDLGSIHSACGSPVFYGVNQYTSRVCGICSDFGTSLSLRYRALARLLAKVSAKDTSFSFRPVDIAPNLWASVLQRLEQCDLLRMSVLEVIL